MGLQVFSRRPILVFWDPKLSNWTSWEKTRRLDSRRVWAARVWLKHRMVLIVPISRIFSLFFDLRGWGVKISQDVQLLFFRPKAIELDVLRKKPAGSIPGGSGHRVFDWSIFWRPLFISNSLGSFCIPLFFETIDTTYDLEIISYFSDLGLFPFGNMKFDPTTYELL